MDRQWRLAHARRSTPESTCRWNRSTPRPLGFLPEQKSPCPLRHNSAIVRPCATHFQSRCDPRRNRARTASTRGKPTSRSSLCSLVLRLLIIVGVIVVGDLRSCRLPDAIVGTNVL